MSKILTIDGKDYNIEYTIEASLYNDCIESVIKLLSSMEMAQDNDFGKIVKSMSDIPQTTLIMFYAGLLENHGIDGDGSVASISDAKKLIKKYFSEHTDDENANFYGVMEILLAQMSEDGFFKQIGLEQMMSQAETEETKKKTTKKTTKVGEK